MYKGKDEAIGERDKEQEQLLSDEKYYFIQTYLVVPQVHYAPIVATSAGESGFVTEGTASEAGHLDDTIGGKY